MKGMDQVALERIVSPSAAVDSLVHDSYLCNSRSGFHESPFPPNETKDPFTRIISHRATPCDQI
jgi:hypothetical protein